MLTASAPYCFGAYRLQSANNVETEASLEELTPEAATSLIEQEMAGKASRDLARKTALESADILSQTELQQDGRTITFNRIRTPERPAVGAGEEGGASVSAKPKMTEAAWAERLASQPKQAHLSLGGKVYDGSYAELVWRHPENPRESFVIWTNVNLNYLQPLGTFEWADTVYTYTVFTENISREAESETIVQAAKRGFSYESRWRTPPVDFASAFPEYLVVAEEAAAVPPELYEQMDALLGYYLANETELRVTYQRQAALGEARRQYREANPPEPEDVTINFYPLSERRKGVSK